MSYQLKDLPYSYDALEPYIDSKTMEIHHDKHHNGYVTKLNAALEQASSIKEKPLESLLADPSSIPSEVRTAVINNGGGHYNHDLFWQTITPGGPKTPQGALKGAIDDVFGGYDAFKEQFSAAAATRFGSGWAWLSKNAQGKLIVHSTANQDTPLAEGFTPIIGLDVWEHAYYLKYQNLRPKYIEAFWNVLNWEVAESRY